jgi:ADP-dependent NAD(P)H-hydrate dehydratase / NAD(P)H-hydrate epimerase
MQRILSTLEMQAIDKKSLESFPNQDFMKIAAEGLAKKIAEISQEVYINDIALFPFVTIVCGKGNNGGDGFKLAYLLASQKYNLKVFSLARPETLKGDALKAFTQLQEALPKPDSDTIRFINQVSDIDDFIDYIKSTQEDKEVQHILVDALLGIGIKGEAQGLTAEIILTINSLKHQISSITVLACDCPSGIDLDSGLVNHTIVKADYTVTMGFTKLASCFYPAKYFFGKQSIQPIPYPEAVCAQEHKSRIFKISHKEIANLLPNRNQEGSKYDHGTATIIAGSANMPGAGFLTGLSAMRSGLGLVHLYSEPESKTIIASQLPEIITHDLKDLNQKTITDVTTIGPGLGRDHGSLIRELVINSNEPIILDADGINAFKDHSELLKKHRSPLIITPHLKEYSRLFPDDSLETLLPIEKIMILKKRALELNATILLKGPTTIIVDPDGDCFLNDNDNSALATAGSGDVLTGIISGISAQLIHSKKPYFKNLFTDSAIISSYLHGFAGNLASKELSEYSVIARDIIQKLSLAFCKIKKSFS